MGPEAPGTSAGDHAGLGPRDPLALQETSPQLLGTETADESGEAQWQADCQVPPAPSTVLTQTLVVMGAHPMGVKWKNPGDPGITGIFALGPWARPTPYSGCHSSVRVGKG